MISLLPNGSRTRPIAFFDGRMIDLAQFSSHVAQLSQILKKHTYNINLCDNRYHFLVAFAAGALLKQIALLPGSRLQSELERLKNDYPDSYQISDATVAKICRKETQKTHVLDCGPLIKSDQTVAIVFTSGTTGTPTAHGKTWGQLVVGAKKTKRRFDFNGTTRHIFVATVPPQHMFGFETTIVYPLVNEIAIHAGCPFYPWDINNAIAEASSLPVILITTPLHLKACQNADMVWNDIDFIISSTSALPQETAEKIRTKLNTTVFEIYGSSEVGVMATRQTNREDKWRLLDGYVLDNRQGTVLRVPEYQMAIPIPDTVKIYDSNYFTVLGRHADVVKIGGKRESLRNLTKKLNTVEGIEDGVFLMPNPPVGKNHHRVRLIAFVVAPNLNAETIRTRLMAFIDPIFLPKPIIFLEKLPYNTLGKLPRAALLELLNTGHNGCGT